MIKVFLRRFSYTRNNNKSDGRNTLIFGISTLALGYSACVYNGLLPTPIDLMDSAHSLFSAEHNINTTLQHPESGYVSHKVFFDIEIEGRPSDGGRVRL